MLWRMIGMSNHVIILPAADYDKVNVGGKIMFLRTKDLKLNVKVTDWIPLVFKDLDKNMLVEILDIRLVKFGELTDRLAVKCGFDNVTELKKCLVSREPTLDNMSLLYAYTFEVMGTSEKVGED